MHEIYSKPEIVYVWLGEHGQSQEDAMMEFFKGPQNTVFQTLNHYIQGLGTLSKPATPPVAPKPAKHLDYAVGGLPYWQRAWVVQEYVLAKERLILYSKHKRSWSTFQATFTTDA